VAHAEPDAELIEGDCRDWLPGIESGTVDAIICDPPYPCIKRSYGTLTEAEWHDLMRVVVAECRRILKPSGSAVFILQPNSRKIGSMRAWLWEFMAWTAREWNMVQDAWWWNISALPNGGATSSGLLKSSLKACVWLGPTDCYRDQDSVLDRSEKAWTKRRWDRSQPDTRVSKPSGNSTNNRKFIETVERRGGTIPFNVLPMGNGSRHDMAGMHGHGAGTPINVMDWWVRYISPPGGLVCDPFVGSGTTALAALRRGRRFVGGDKMPEYVAIARNRIAAERSRTPLLARTVPGA
jgi:DNA modification methylase